MITEIKKIVVEVEDSVAFITLNNSEKHNAINVTMMRELRTVIDLVQADDSVNVMVLGAAGDEYFSAGIDLSTDGLNRCEDLKASMLKDLIPLMESIQQFSKPTIAKGQGVAIGLGCS